MRCSSHAPGYSWSNPESKPSFRILFLETHTIKTSEVPSVGSPKSYKWASKIKTNWSTCLRSNLCPNTSSLHTPPHPALTKPTSPLNRDSSFDKSNLICPIGASPNLNPTYTLLSSRTSWPLILCSTHSPFTLQTSSIPNHVVWAANSGYTKLRAPHPRARSTACTKPRAHTWLINGNIIPQKDTMIPYVSQPRYPLNNEVLAMFFFYATIPATSHYPEFTDTYSPQYGRISFSLHFMTNILFSWPSFANFHILAPWHGQPNSVYITIPDPTHRIGLYSHLSSAIHLI